jgi:V/A-type H+-transporting ATPase subunit E
MSYRELIDALEKECGEKIKKIWKEAEEEADKAKADALKRTEEMRCEYERKESSAVRERTDAVVAEAKNRARIIRLRGDEELARRLYRLAAESLSQVRDSRYRELFASLVRELPSHPWDIVKVNPGDAGIAGEFFPGAEIMPDTAITGGIEVTDKNAGVRIVNTLEKRLDRAWQDILPELIQDIREGIIHGNPPED